MQAQAATCVFPVRRTPKPAKDDGSSSPDRKAFIEGDKSGACTPRSGTVIYVQSNRPAGDVESISRDFDAAREATDCENSPQRSDLASPTPRRLLSRLRATETTEP